MTTRSTVVSLPHAASKNSPNVKHKPTTVRPVSKKCTHRKLLKILFGIAAIIVVLCEGTVTVGNRSRRERASKYKFAHAHDAFGVEKLQHPGIDIANPPLCFVEDRAECIHHLGVKMHAALPDQFRARGGNRPGGLVRTFMG
mgnify:CR=1 FL=1